MEKFVWPTVTEGTIWWYGITSVIIIVAAFVLSRTASVLMTRLMDRDIRNHQQDLTRLRFAKNAISVVIWFTALGVIIYTIPQLKALAITLFAGAGILVVILGIAAQAAFANIIAGIFIVISRPFRVGDLIRIGELHMGFVDDLTLRHTVIKDFQNRRIIIPNSTISAANILNYNIEDPKVCEYIEMGISYDSNVDKAMELMRDEALKHPSCIDNRSPEDKAMNEPVVRVRLIGFGDSSVNLRAYVWVNDPESGFFLRYDLYKSIKARFDQEGIEIPFPYRTLVFKDPKTENPLKKGK